MISLRITDKREDIRRWTGLPSDNYDEALWDAGFNLDDLDMCIESDIRLIDDDGNYRSEAWWLMNRMEAWCCGYTEVEYNGKWYYTVYHA